MRNTLRSTRMLFLWLLVPAVAAQSPVEIDSRLRTADTNNAVIEGKVTLPSGFSADRNVKITLKNAQSNLSTLYSNKHGEFRFANLSEGVYYVQAEIEGPDFEPAIHRVPLGRGMVSHVTLQLREKKAGPISRSGARVVSAAELHQSVPTSAKKEYQRGLRFVSKGNFAQAATHFQEALAIYPEYLAARNDLGAQHLKLKHLDEAEKHFQIVIERDPKNFNAQFNLGLVHVEREDYWNAINQFNRAMAIDGTRPVARLWLGFALLETGDLASAERELTKALIMGGGECVAAHYHLARLYLTRGDTAEAKRAIRAYLVESPKGEYSKDAVELEKQLKSGR